MNMTDRGGVGGTGGANLDHHTVAMSGASSAFMPTTL